MVDMEECAVDKLVAVDVFRYAYDEGEQLRFGQIRICTLYSTLYCMGACYTLRTVVLVLDYIVALSMLVCIVMSGVHHCKTTSGIQTRSILYFEMKV